MIPVTIRLNERDDQQMIARLNRFEILDQMSGQGKPIRVDLRAIDSQCLKKLTWSLPSLLN